MNEFEDRVGAALRSIVTPASGYAAPAPSDIARRARRMRRRQRARVGAVTAAFAVVFVTVGVVLASRGHENPVTPPNVTTTIPGPTASTSTTPPAPTTRPVPTTVHLSDDPSLHPTKVATIPGVDIAQWEHQDARWFTRDEILRSPQSRPGAPRIVGVHSELRAGECIGVVDGPGFFTVARCTATTQVLLQGFGVDKAELQHLLDAATDEVPTRIDLTGTDLVSLGVRSSGSESYTAHYQLANDVTADLHTYAVLGPPEDPTIALEMAPTGTIGAEVVDVNGSSAASFTPPGTQKVTSLQWSPEPGVGVYLTYAGGAPSTALQAARTVVLRPVADVKAELTPNERGDNANIPSTVDPRLTAGITTPPPVPIPVGSYTDLAEPYVLNITGTSFGGNFTVVPPPAGLRPASTPQAVIDGAQPTQPQFTGGVVLRFGVFSNLPRGGNQNVPAWIIELPGREIRGCIGCTPVLQYPVLVVRDDDPTQFLAMTYPDTPPFR